MQEIPRLLRRSSFITCDGFCLISAANDFMYQGIFDTDFDKYIEDAVALFIKYRLHDRIRESGRLARGLEDKCAGVW